MAIITQYAKGFTESVYEAEDFLSVPFKNTVVLISAMNYFNFFFRLFFFDSSSFQNSPNLPPNF